MPATSQENDRYDAVVVGAGPAGLASALALSSAGCGTVCVGQSFAPDSADTRTTALLQASVRLLENIGVWPLCSAHAAPLEGIRILDDTGNLLRAPEIEFHYRELGDRPFGYNIANADLVRALGASMATKPAVRMMRTDSAMIAGAEQDRIMVSVPETGTLTARLVAAADGRKSACREAAGIAVRAWSYDQCAIACSFSHSGAHENFSNEFHRRSGPFTTVPLPGNTSSLVWVERTGECNRIMGLDEDAFRAALEERLHGILGQVGTVGPRAAFPLSGLTPAVFARNRVALIGEAAHVLPPIGAQGLNLGFRDAASLAEIAGNALANGDDPGGDDCLKAYHRSRRADVLVRTAAVDALNRSLLSSLLPVHAVRSAGLHLLQNVGPLRRFVMRQGVSPGGGTLPALMR